MEFISHLWNIFIEGNFLNFLLFVLFFVWLFKKINFGKIIAGLQSKIADLIDATKKDKDKSIKELSEAKMAIKNIDSEITTIVNDAKKSAEVISEKIKTEAENQVENIGLNAKKVIDAEGKRLVSKLTKNASKASVAVAKNQIIKALEQNPGLHEKYINESIDELDRLNF